jgi:YfiH family protein
MYGAGRLRKSAAIELSGRRSLMHDFDIDWLRPAWPAPAHVKTVFTSRANGVSRGCYAGLNLGTHVGDAARAVAGNRARLAAAIGYPPVFLDQVHGADVAVLDGSGTIDAEAVPVRADGAATRSVGAVCTVMVADCLPVLFTDRRGRAVGAAHAGWRGLLGVGGRGVIEQAAADVRDLAECSGSDLLAWLGPCIGPREFEVGDDVRRAFVDTDPAAAACFRPIHGAAAKWMADLPGLARQRLAALRIAGWGNDGSDAWCTVRQPLRFFSHRRDSIRLGGSGRMAACIWLDSGDGPDS